MFKFSTIKILRAAVIAGIYSALTILLAPLSYFTVQIRFAEALTLLPLLFPEAVIGVTVGCLISNIFNGMWTDIVFGTLATFCAALLTYYIGRLFRLDSSAKDKLPQGNGALNPRPFTATKKRLGVFLAALPPVLINAFVVPFIIFAYIKEDMATINIFTSNSFLLYILGFTSVMIGQAIAVYGIGIPLYTGLKKSMKPLRSFSLHKPARNASGGSADSKEE